MVRLKGKRTPKRLSTPSTVSIPYGSIKRTKEFIELMCSYSVSIPYGSIKSRPGCRTPWCCLVSIPYGSIKSCADRGPVRDSRVSIPYGSIKRVCRCSWWGCAPAVSIPYGSIKSAPAWRCSTWAPWFQFLMVRLKASLTSCSPICWNSFQFLMVRLKATPPRRWS